ncbi:hypothetical protein R38712_05310 [Ralstonia pickettii]|uniref:Uncharacterized protein n=1 Tax=Ralstonia pickettii TaxID=329 RepID=A0ABN9IBN9_RALPI|nr:hypothetical protein R38712_05310 [Ralstonia pickettii]
MPIDHRLRGRTGFQNTRSPQGKRLYAAATAAPDVDRRHAGWRGAALRVGDAGVRPMVEDVSVGKAEQDNRQCNCRQPDSCRRPGCPARGAAADAGTTGSVLPDAAGLLSAQPPTECRGHDFAHAHLRCADLHPAHRAAHGELCTGCLRAESPPGGIAQGNRRCAVFPDGGGLSHTGVQHRGGCRAGSLAARTDRGAATHCRYQYAVARQPAQAVPTWRCDGAGCSSRRDGAGASGAGAAQSAKATGGAARSVGRSGRQTTQRRHPRHLHVCGLHAAEGVAGVAAVGSRATTP